MRSDRHARHSQTQGMWPVFEQPADIARRDVPLDHIAGHHSRVTGCLPLWHPKGGTRGLVALIHHGDDEAIVLKVRDPQLATAAVGIFPHLDWCSLRSL